MKRTTDQDSIAMHNPDGTTQVTPPARGRVAGRFRALPLWALSAVVVAGMGLLAGPGLTGDARVLAGSTAEMTVWGAPAPSPTRRQDAAATARAATVQAAIDATVTAILAGDATSQAVATSQASTAMAPLVVYDFIAQAPAAEWVSAHGTHYLTWNGDAEDSNGCAAWRDNPVLEDGSMPARVLLTIPDWSAGGETLGDYKLPEPIQAGDHLRSRVGFLQGYAAGQVEFKLMVHGIGVHQTVADLTDSAADGVLPAIDVDLTPYAGLQEITLAVRAGASPDQDAAVWVDTRIERP